jgi:hypothetical protein
MAEFWRALKTLKALQAEQAAEAGPALAAHPLEAHPKAPARRARLIHRPQPDEPERNPEPRLEYAMPASDWHAFSRVDVDRTCV